ncbi:GGDEF domain-containing protein [Crenobacter caeni]|uniref:GGDEF domain-containing protein n=1 Tax=Crenobacter caeni TaxID=2705474 RepID=UPI001EF2D794|nr:GGDEF domain-containing protein [Crenobacter caeni]
MSIPTLTDFLSRTLAGLLPDELERSDSRQLVSPIGHLPLLTSRRATMIVNRVRLFALLFALLTPLWIVVDVATLPFPLWAQLAALRLTATAAFAALFSRARGKSSLLHAYRSMATLFAIPTLFYVISHLLMAQHQLDGLSAALGTGYAFLPFVLLAGFAVFPLTLLETAAFAAPVLLAYGLAGLSELGGSDWPSFTAEFWLLILITGVAALASLCQLVLMSALVGQALRDPLTGCYSRRSGEEMLAIQFDQSLRSGAPLSVAFIDLDHFKRVNDEHGHDAGDVLLKNLSKSVNSQLRGGDILARWGGEEFVLILPSTDCEQTMQVLARLYGTGLGERPSGKPVTASIGVAERTCDHAPDWRALVQLADERMYAAKHGGRNGVVCPLRQCASEHCNSCLGRAAITRQQPAVRLETA